MGQACQLHTFFPPAALRRADTVFIIGHSPALCKGNAPCI
jgi:hypothetical protein